jgi:hypothetical protein
MTEFWECSDCLKVGPLDVHGRCSRCGSESVLSQHTIELMREIAQTSWAWRVPARTENRPTAYPLDKTHAKHYLARSWWAFE